MSQTSQTLSAPLNRPPAPPLGEIDGRLSHAASLLAEGLAAIDIDPQQARRLIRMANVCLISTALVVPEASNSRDVLLQGGLAPWQVRRIVDAVEAHLSERLTVSRLGGLVRLSVSYFNRAFKTTFGVTPREYVLGQRIASACEMMLQSDETLGRIAVACGFSDQSHMTRHFQSTFGLPPNAWRRSRRAAPPAASIVATSRSAWSGRPEKATSFAALRYGEIGDQGAVVAAFVERCSF